MSAATIARSMSSTRDNLHGGVRFGVTPFDKTVEGAPRPAKEDDDVRDAMLINGDEEEWAAVEPDAAEEGMRAVFAWFDRWGAKGKIAEGGAQLDSARAAKTIRSGPDGPVVTDGPYLELKEIIGGVVMLEADSIEDAVAVAATWPGLSGSTSVEVRPVVNSR